MVIYVSDSSARIMSYDQLQSPSIL